MSVWMWIAWAVVLIVQNYSFTFVSRARNSGSLSRHMKASVMSNGVWFVSQLFAVSAFMDIITGKAGLGMAVFACVFYTAFTMLGSLVAHKHALKNEKGAAAVGANKKYAQIPVEEWEAIKAQMADYRARFSVPSQSGEAA